MAIQCPVALVIFNLSFFKLNFDPLCAGLTACSPKARLQTIHMNRYYLMQIENAYRESARERDLDHFLVEELSASFEFRGWILDKVESVFIAPEKAYVRVRKSPVRESKDGRQTDVQLGWFSEEKLCACVLLESKVTGGFQVGQAESYAGEVRALRDRLGEQQAVAILIAPASKLTGLSHDGAFEAQVAIEEIIAFLEARLASIEDRELAIRILVRVELLEALCGKRPANGWIAHTIQEKRDFALAYTALAAEILPNLKVRPSTDGPNAITRIFEGLAIPDLPDLKLRHEFGRGMLHKYANVQFPGHADHLNCLRDSGLLEGTPYAADKAGKSLAIRVQTPGINPMLPFEDEHDKVERGLKAIGTMVLWLRENGAALARILKSEAIYL